MHNPDQHNTTTKPRHVRYKGHGLKPWTPADRRGWRTDPELTDTND